MANGENELLIRISGTAKDFVEEVDKVKAKTEDLNKVLGDVAKIGAVSFAAAAASIAIVTKEYADYEKALVGVGKTTNIEGKKLEDFGKKFQEMSGRIPVATNELLGIAQAAGQLGVKGEENLLKFSETVAKLGVATDLSGEEAATALTRILTVTGEGVENIDKFGSVIVALGNNFAATESEIARVATEVTRATSVFGVSAAEGAALAAALKSVGVQAELGGSAVGRAFRAIDKAVRNGGVSLQRLSDLTGMTGEQLKDTFETNSTLVFQKFIEGLGRVAASGGDTTATLAGFKLKGEEILKVLPVIAQRSELVGKALEMANAEMKNATALNEEAARAFDTLAADTQILENNFTTLAVKVGKELAPELGGLIRDLASITKSFSEQEKGLIPLVAALVKWIALIGASVTTVTSAGIAYLAWTRIIAGLRVAFEASRIAVVGFTSAATFGLTAILAFLPEIISGAAKLFEAFGAKNEPEGLDEISAKLEKLQKQKAEIAASKTDVGFEKNDVVLKRLDDEINKYKELYQEKLRASKDFGTGSVLVRPETDTRGFDPLKGLQTPIPLKNEQETPEDAAANTRAIEDAKNAELTKAQQKRLATLAAENDKEAELNKLRAEGATSEEIKLAERRIEIEQQKNAALQLEQGALRDAELENARVKSDALLLEETKFQAKKKELKETELAQKREFEAALDEGDTARLQKLNEDEIKALQSKFATERSIEKKILQERLEEKANERARFIEDEQRYGTQIANMKMLFNTKEVQGVRDTSQQLAALMNSRNNTLKGIGKAAAATNAAIATGEGAIKAYASLAGIPIIGPALGIAAAAALVAYGVEQQRNIWAANSGGMVPYDFGSKPGVDSVPSMLTPGELVVPTQNFDEVVESVSAARGGKEGGAGVGNTIYNFNGDFYGDEVFVDRMAERLYDAQRNRNVRLVPSKT